MPRILVVEILTGMKTINIIEPFKQLHARKKCKPWPSNWNGFKFNLVPSYERWMNDWLSEAWKTMPKLEWCRSMENLYKILVFFPCKSVIFEFPDKQKLPTKILSKPIIPIAFSDKSLCGLEHKHGTFYCLTINRKYRLWWYIKPTCSYAHRTVVYLGVGRRPRNVMKKYQRYRIPTSISHIRSHTKGHLISIIYELEIWVANRKSANPKSRRIFWSCNNTFVLSNV